MATEIVIAVAAGTAAVLVAVVAALLFVSLEIHHRRQHRIREIRNRLDYNRGREW